MLVLDEESILFNDDDKFDPNEEASEIEEIRDMSDGDGRVQGNKGVWTIL